MFIDFLTLILINLVAGLVLLAYYLWEKPEGEDQRPYAAAFIIIGLLALIPGLRMAFTWPLPGSYNVGYSETTVLFGGVFLAAGIALSRNWSLFPAAIYAFFAGADAVIVGARIFTLGLTKSPAVSAAGFILAGLCGVLAVPYLKWLKNYRVLRLAAVLALLIIAFIWAVVFIGALWEHMESFVKWAPATSQGN